MARRLLLIFLPHPYMQMPLTTPTHWLSSLSAQDLKCAGGTDDDRRPRQRFLSERDHHRPGHAFASHSFKHHTHYASPMQSLHTHTSTGTGTFEATVLPCCRPSAFAHASPQLDSSQTVHPPSLYSTMAAADDSNGDTGPLKSRKPEGMLFCVEREFDDRFWSRPGRVSRSSWKHWCFGHAFVPRLPMMPGNETMNLSYRA